MIKKTVARDKTITIQVLTDLTAVIHKEFQEAYMNEPMESHFIIDLAKTKIVDSSGLSLLLLLIEFSTAPRGSIVITGCNSLVRKALDIAYFQQLFRIE